MNAMMGLCACIGMNTSISHTNGQTKYMWHYLHSMLYLMLPKSYPSLYQFVSPISVAVPRILSSFLFFSIWINIMNAMVVYIPAWLHQHAKPFYKPSLWHYLHFNPHHGSILTLKRISVFSSSSSSSSAAHIYYTILQLYLYL